MRKSQILFLQILSAAFLLNATPTFAQVEGDEENSFEEGILFKIHNVVPVKNSSGLIASCDFSATFYNRTQKTISDTQLTLMWEDEAIDDVINMEKREEKENLRTRKTNVSRYSTSSFTSSSLSMPLRLPTIKPGQQVTLKSKINTDRCFLLLNNVEVKVNKCRLKEAGTDKKKATINSNSSACTGMFLFVSDKNPEYYSEFKEISVNAENIKEKDDFTKQREELENLYSITANSLNSLADSLKD